MGLNDAIETINEEYLTMTKVEILYDADVSCDCPRVAEATAGFAVPPTMTMYPALILHPVAIASQRQGCSN